MAGYTIRVAEFNIHWFGNNPPRASAWFAYDSATGKFISDPTGWVQEDGHRQACVDMAKAASDILNTYKDAVGGTIINTTGLNHSFAIWEDQTPPFRYDGRSFENAQDMVEFGVLAVLKTLQTAGGDLYVKRAILNSKAATLDDLNGDIQIGADFGVYMENKAIIDLLIAMDPNSTFAAGWIVTLARAEEIGVTGWSRSDFYGGMGAFLSSIGLDKLGATADNVAVSMDGATLRLDVVIDGQIVRSMRIDNFASVMGYALAAGATGSTGNDLWFAAATAADGQSNDILIGGAGNDTINGGLGWDFIQGGGGADAITGGAGNDMLLGGEGDDVLYGDENQPFAPLPTSAQSDAAAPGAPLAVDASRRAWFGGSVSATVFNVDEIHGGAGNDQISGGAGDDRLFGGAGDDVIYGDAGNDLLVGGAGADILYGGAGFDTASYQDATAGVTVDLAGTAAYGTSSDGDRLYSIEDLIGSRFADQLYGDDNANIIDGGMGSDTIDGRGGRDAVSFFSSLYGVEVDMQAGQAITRMTGGATETDTLINIEDVIGSRYDDILRGSTAGGVLDGGAGDDTIMIASDDLDVANGAAATDVRGGEGVDALSFADWATTRGARVNLNGSAGGNQFSGVEKVIGSAYGDTITGGDAAEIIVGGLGDDILEGGGGKDVYLMNRGDGNDYLRAFQLASASSYWTASISISPATLAIYGSPTVSYGDGTSDGFSVIRATNEKFFGGDVIVFGGDITYHDIFGTMRSLNESQFALADQTYTGAAGAIGRQQLLGNLGSVDLTVGVKAAGAYGDAANALGSLQSSVTIQGGGILAGGANSAAWVGADGVHYVFDTAASVVDRLAFADSANIDFSKVKYFKDGSAADDALSAANGQSTWLYGGAGADTISGADQGDVLVGGAGDDVLAGGAGADQYAYWLGDGHDIITDASGGDVIVFGGGISQSDVTARLGKLDNPADANSFRAALFSDSKRDLRLEIRAPSTGALSGSVTIVDFQNTHTIDDKLRFAGDVEISLKDLLAAQGTFVRPAVPGTQGDDTLIGADAGEDFTGLGGNDVMQGNGGDDTLSGGAGNDVLLGGDGADVISGGEGDDVIYADAGNDVVDGGAGADTASYATSSAGVNVNLATGTGFGGDATFDRLVSIENVTGSAFADTLTGNAGANVLTGLGGNDALNGGLGNDVYVFAPGSGADVVADNGGADVIDFKSGIDASDLWLAREASNLVIYHLGTSDKVTVSNWYGGAANQVETIKAEDFGKALYAADVNNLINMMASFAPEIGVDPSRTQPANLSEDYRVAVNSVWHTAA